MYFHCLNFAKQFYKCILHITAELKLKLQNMNSSRSKYIFLICKVTEVIRNLLVVTSVFKRKKNRIELNITSIMSQLFVFNYYLNKFSLHVQVLEQSMHNSRQELSDVAIKMQAAGYLVSQGSYALTLFRLTLNLCNL